MKLTDQIFNLFSTDFELGELEYQDRYEGSCRTKTLGLPDENDLKSLVDKIPSRDSFIFTINYFGKFIEYGKDNNFTEFISNLKEEMQYDFEPDEDDFIELKLNISKHIETNVLSIYSLDSFEKYIISLNLKDLLGVISIINRLPRFIFNIQEDSQYELKSNRIAFTTDSDLDINGISGSLKRLVEVCNFQNSSQYYFSPDDFFIERTPTRPLEIIFDKLKVIFSLIYICDSSLILGDCLVANINGYRRIDLNLKFSSLDTSEYEYAFNVYRWIYSDGNLYDKIGLARNVISLHTSDNSLNISKNTFGSILSGFKIYLKDTSVRNNQP